MNHMKANWARLCGRQTINERNRNQPRGQIPLYALKVGGRPKTQGASSANISGNIAAARAAAAGTGEDLDLEAYFSDLDDQQERNELSSLLESSEEESPAPTVETKAHMEGALAAGENILTEGGTSDVPSKRRGDGGDSDDDQPRAKRRPISARKTGSGRKQE
ncbi:hypothetical protein N7509_009552 [Penicillium cosmopolitanum]|uniref:Uncharacterized protein n=1 Tax=Penicillium cosmopolitanum TaxID=1131564 RepID=A0A9W9VPP8_9EURO|nr:uncharacterized protein N7509_009552 [Penicillium cosmopolitanum]KAJ5387011.1 hypothetical protein N7509_009552 [Penicillium cosmopolitanum]